MNTCIRCGDTKPDDSFKTTKAGNLRSWCIDCTRAYKAAWKKSERGKESEAKYRSSPQAKARARKWREENRERVREINREASKAHYGRNRERLQKKQSDDRKRYPEKHKARQMVSLAVFFGMITKPGTCENCGTRKRLEAHHRDYWKPLDVVWLCTPCHSAEH